jgi:hypothetical protein
MFLPLFFSFFTNFATYASSFSRKSGGSTNKKPFFSIQNVLCPCLAFLIAHFRLLLLLSSLLLRWPETTEENVRHHFSGCWSQFSFFVDSTIFRLNIDVELLLLCD